jgi:hypothetical protein
MENNLIKINSDRKLIDLPAYADLPNITRKASIHETKPHYKNKTVTLVVDVFHFSGEKELAYLPGRCEIVADNNDIVNALTGDEIPKDENGKYITDEDGNYPDNSIPNFDYLWDLVNIKKVITMEQAEDLYVTKRIEKINSKLYK